MSLNSRSCWDILEIEATEDKKVIKRAYHKLLRRYKPDEKPDEFKILYEAYQDALVWEDYNWDMSEWDYDENDDEDFEYSEVDDDDEEDASNKEWEAESKLRNDYYERWEKFEEKVDALTYDNNYPELFNTLEKWKFLEDLDVGSDLEFYKEASNYLFLAVTDFDEKHPTILLNAKVIHYFDKIFLWKQQWQTFDSESTIFDYLDVKKAIPTLDKNNPNSYRLASMSERLQAFTIDIVIASVLVLLFSDMTIESFNYILVTYFFIQLALVWVLGFRSLGQFAIKLEVLEGKEKEAPSKTARGIRLIFTMLSFLTLVMLITEPLENAIYIVIFSGINITLFVRYGRLLQDYSATRVYKT